MSESETDFDDAIHLLELEMKCTALNHNSEDIENQLNPYAEQFIDNYHSHLFKTLCQHAAEDDKSVDWHCVLQSCGKNITHIYDGGFCMSAECFSLAQEFCPHLKTINISLTIDNLQSVQQFLPQWQSLEEIALSGPALLEELLISLRELPRLQKLSLRNFEYTDGECIALNCLSHVTHLDINCLNHELLDKMSGLLKNLKRFGITTMPTTQTLRALPEYCGKLEQLQLYDAINGLPRSVPYFRNLKIMEIHDPKSTAFIFIDQLDQRYNNQLQTLIMPGKCIFEKEAKRISHLSALKTLSCVLPDVRCLNYLIHMQLQHLSLYDCVNLKNINLLKILRHCQTLSCLEITMCPLINMRFIDTALEILFRNGVSPQVPFELHLTGSSITAADNTKLFSLPHFDLLNLHLN